MHVPVLALSIVTLLAATAPVQAQVEPPAAAASTSATTVKPVTVRPDTPPKGRVVSSTDAASLTSPDFTAKDAEDPPRAVSLGGNAAAGIQSVDNTAPGGFLKVNPDGKTRTDVGVTQVF